MPTLHITAFDSGAQVSAIKAVRDARRALGADDGIRSAADAVYALAKTGEAQLVGAHDDAEVVKAAYGVLTEGSVEGATDLPEGPQEIAEDEPDLEVTDWEYQQALVFLAMSNGVPARALTFINALDEIRQDLGPVRQALLSAFSFP